MTADVRSTAPAKPPKTAAKNKANKGAKAAAGATDTAPKSALQLALEKLGLVRDIDLALHLPLRYEDETHITLLRDAREGDVIQIEARVVASEVVYRPRRQLVVKVDDGTDVCTLRFFNFYPSQQKAMEVGRGVRARGEIKGGFWVGRCCTRPAKRPAATCPPH